MDDDFLETRRPRWKRLHVFKLPYVMMQLIWANLAKADPLKLWKSEANGELRNCHCARFEVTFVVRNPEATHDIQGFQVRTFLQDEPQTQEVDGTLGHIIDGQMGDAREVH